MEFENHESGNLLGTLGDSPGICKNDLQGGGIYPHKP
jgi:hypothetical protein